MNWPGNFCRCWRNEPEDQREIMKSTIPFILALVLTGTIANAGPLPVTVAVYKFTGDSDTATYPDKVTALVAADLTTETNLVLLERADLTKALKEQAFGLSGIVSSDGAAKIGQITGAKVLVTGQVIKTGGDHLIITGNIIGTETGRLLAAKVEGTADHLDRLTSDLSQNLARIITSQAGSLEAAPQESSAERVERIINNIGGTNRPSVSVDIRQSRIDAKGHATPAESEFGSVLLKAGFRVVDENSTQKPEVEISGVATYDTGRPHNGLFPARGILELKVQKRQTGKIIAFERTETTGSSASQRGAIPAAEASAVDELAEKILPLLAQ